MTDDSDQGSIFLIRHGKPDFPYTKQPDRKISSLLFNQLMIDYDDSGLEKDYNIQLLSKIPNEVLTRIQNARFFVSDLKRALETAELLMGDRFNNARPDAIFREVPLPLYSRDFKLSARKLLFLARLRWYAGFKCIENKAQAKKRAQEAADLLITAHNQQPDRDVTLFSHGFFLFLVSAVLKKKGWGTEKSTPFQYLEIRKFDAKKDNVKT